MYRTMQMTDCLNFRTLWIYADRGELEYKVVYPYGLAIHIYIYG